MQLVECSVVMVETEFVRCLLLLLLSDFDVSVTWIRNGLSEAVLPVTFSC